jgi:hypothetical protein
MKRVVLLTLVLVFGVFASSQASTIDFRLAPFPAAHNLASYVYVPQGLTLTALPVGAKLYQDSTDGLGVMLDYENDEVEGTETLQMHFDVPTALNRILITDLFYQEFLPNVNTKYNETGEYSFDNVTWIPITAVAGQIPGSTNGELDILFGSAPTITDIYFEALGFVLDDGQIIEAHEFSVALLEVDNVPAVPIPGAIWLLGSGLLGFVGLRRKFRS